jgi:putative ABC transport system permease protein
VTRFLRNIKLGVKNLLLHKLRSMLTMLGVVFGVGSVVAMLSVGEGAREQAMSEIDKLGLRNVLVTSIKPIDADGGDGVRRRLTEYGITYDDVARIRNTLTGIARVVPAKAVNQRGKLGDTSVDLRLVGTTADWSELVNRRLLAGRHLQPADELQANDVVVLTEQGARKLLAGEGTVGKLVTIGGSNYQIVGIVESATGPEQTDSASGGVPTPDENVDAYVPLEVVRTRLGDIRIPDPTNRWTRERVELQQIIIEAEARQDVPGVAATVSAMFNRFHAKEDWRMTVPLELLRQAEKTAQTFNIVLGSIAGISLLVGGIGIMNIMLASVTERTREIGIRRAIGARRGQIIQQFLIETIVLSTAGGVIGVALGVLIPEIIEYYAGMPTIVRGWTIILSVGISVLTGVVFGLYPAVRAASLDPIKALRHE